MQCAARLSIHAAVHPCPRTGAFVLPTECQTPPAGGFVLPTECQTPRAGGFVLPTECQTEAAMDLELSEGGHALQATEEEVRGPASNAGR